MKTIQANEFTGFGRYIPQYRIVRSAAQERPYKTAMIFGGSVGLEAFELSCLLPELQKISCFEIAVGPLRASRFYSAVDNIEFLMSSWKSIELRAPYDIICANSVLCDHPSANTKSVLNTFSVLDFRDLIRRLSELLAPGGCLVVCNANYSILDIKDDLGLHPVSGSTPLHGTTSLFDTKSRKIIHTILGHGQYPCFFSKAECLEDDRARVTSSVFFRDNPFSVPKEDLSGHDKVAEIDPYFGNRDDAPEWGTRPLKYTIAVRKLRTEQGFWLEYIDSNGTIFNQYPLRY